MQAGSKHAMANCDAAEGQYTADAVKQSAGGFVEQRSGGLVARNVSAAICSVHHEYCGKKINFREICDEGDTHSGH